MIAYGCVQKDHSVHVHTNGKWETTYDLAAILTNLRNEYGEIVIFITEGLASEQFRFEITDKPF